MGWSGSKPRSFARFQMRYAMESFLTPKAFSATICARVAMSNSPCFTRVLWLSLRASTGVDPFESMVMTYDLPSRRDITTRKFETRLLSTLCLTSLVRYSLTYYGPPDMTVLRIAGRSHRRAQNPNVLPLDVTFIINDPGFSISSSNGSQQALIISTCSLNPFTNPEPHSQNPLTYPQSPRSRLPK